MTKWLVIHKRNPKEYDSRSVNAHLRRKLSCAKKKQPDWRGETTRREDAFKKTPKLEAQRPIGAVTQPSLSFFFFLAPRASTPLSSSCANLLYFQPRLYTLWMWHFFGEVTFSFRNCYRRTRARAIYSMRFYLHLGIPKLHADTIQTIHFANVLLVNFFWLASESLASFFIFLKFPSETIQMFHQWPFWMISYTFSKRVSFGKHQFYIWDNICQIALFLFPKLIHIYQVWFFNCLYSHRQELY